MIDRICLIVNYNLYESKRVFAADFAAALQRHGVEVLIVDVMNKGFGADEAHQIIDFGPELLASFNSFVPDASGRYLWDYLRIPTLSILVDPAIYATGMPPSPDLLVSCVDRTDKEWLQEQGYEPVFFLPHGVAIDDLPPQKKIYDVVLTGTCYDYESLQKHWEANLPTHFHRILEQAAEQVLAPGCISLLEALTQALKLDGIETTENEFYTLFTYLDYYTRGIDRVQLVRSLPNTSIHIFGELGTDHPSAKKGWDYYLKGMPHVTIHPSLNFEEALLIQKKSKICLNSMPFFKDGSHERILTALAADAVPLTSETKWVREEFIDNEELLIYCPGNYQNLEKRIQDLLAHEDKRSKIAQKGKDKVALRHTWDSRAKELIAQLSDL